MKSWLFLGTAIIAEVVATSCLKSSEGFTKVWPSLLVVLGYGIAFFFLSLTLKTIPIGMAYGIWAGLGIVLITMVGWVVFDQKLDAASMLGLALIVTGVVIINVFSKASMH